MIKEDLSNRLLNFTAEAIRIMEPMARTAAGFHIAKQLMRSASSAGANYEESCGAESRNDFIHKMQIVLKELRESVYWLKLIQKVQLLPDQQTDGMRVEANELCRIIAKSVITAKSRR
jgi:four helix bundle protein